MQFTAARHWKLTLPDDPAGRERLITTSAAAGAEDFSAAAGGNATGRIIAWLIKRQETTGLDFLPVPLLVEEDDLTWAAVERPGVGGSVSPLPRPGTGPLAAALAAADAETENHYTTLLALADAVRAYLSAGSPVFTEGQPVEFLDRSRNAEWAPGVFVRLDGDDAVITPDSGGTCRTPAGRVRLSQPRRTS